MVIREKCFIWQDKMYESLNKSFLQQKNQHLSQKDGLQKPDPPPKKKMTQKLWQRPKKILSAS